MARVADVAAMDLDAPGGHDPDVRRTTRRLDADLRRLTGRHIDSGTALRAHVCAGERARRRRHSAAPRPEGHACECFPVAAARTPRLLCVGSSARRATLGM